MKKPLLITIIVIIVAGAGFLLIRSKDGTEPLSILDSNKNFTFQVTVPENTPEQDTVFILITDIPPAFIEVPMEKVGPYTFEKSFTREELKDAYDFPEIRYRYTRNGWNFMTAEFLPEGIPRKPNIKPEDEHGSNYTFRIANFQKGKVQKDTVERWRWFPEGEVVLEDISDLGPQESFLPRVNNIPFRLGQGIEDLYVPEFDPLFDILPRRLKDEGFNWVVLYPPWQWVQEEPLPKVSNDIENNPNYPDEKFIEQVQAYKKVGIKVYVEPQLCCTAIDTANRSAEWWDAFVSEVEKFLIYYARLANQAGADALLFEGLGIDPEIDNYDARMKEMFDNVKSEFKGEIVAKVVPFLPEGVDPAVSFIPELHQIPWGDEVDFFMLDAEGQLSAKDNPTREELIAGAGRILDLVKPVYEKFSKPVWVRSTYFAVKEVWKGTEFMHSKRMPYQEEYEFKYPDGHKVSGRDQARVDDAFFAAISSRPWIIGFLHFGYTHWDVPLLPDWNIRAREAEQVWIKWNEFINRQNQ